MKQTGDFHKSSIEGVGLTTFPCLQCGAQAMLSDKACERASRDCINECGAEALICKSQATHY